MATAAAETTTLLLPTVTKDGNEESVPENTTLEDVLRDVSRVNNPYLVKILSGGVTVSIFHLSYKLERGRRYQLLYRSLGLASSEESCHQTALVCTNGPENVLQKGCGYRMVEHKERMQKLAARNKISSFPKKLSPLTREPALKKVVPNQELPLAIVHDYGEEMHFIDGTQVCDITRIVGPGSCVLKIEGSVERLMRDPEYVLERGCEYRTVQHKERMQKLAASNKISSSPKKLSPLTREPVLKKVILNKLKKVIPNKLKKLVPKKQAPNELKKVVPKEEAPKKELPSAILHDYGIKHHLMDDSRVCDVIKLVGPGSCVLKIEGSVERLLTNREYVLQRGCEYRALEYEDHVQMFPNYKRA